MLNLESLRRQRSSRTLAGRFVDIPASRNQTKKSLSESQLGFDRVMQKVVDWEKTGLLFLISLPRGRTIVADATQHRVSIFSFGEFDDHSQNLVHR